jgi:hypothetical protein
MSSLGTSDLVAALTELHDRFGCQHTSATFALGDGVRLTIALEGERGDLTIIRDGDEHAGSVSFP